MAVLLGQASGSLLRQTVKNPENYDEAGEYIGPMTSPIDELKEMVVKLQARVEELEKGGEQKKTTRRRKKAED